jgi:hypothetical protein
VLVALLVTLEPTALMTLAVRTQWRPRKSTTQISACWRRTPILDRFPRAWAHSDDGQRWPTIRELAGLPSLDIKPGAHVPRSAACG